VFRNPASRLGLPKPALKHFFPPLSPSHSLTSIPLKSLPFGALSSWISSPFFPKGNLPHLLSFSPIKFVHGGDFYENGEILDLCMCMRLFGY
jgi:hypothetical protein